RRCKPTPDGTRCGKHKHCERGLCVACARNGDDCAQVNAAACCRGRCCDAATGNCPAGVDFCCCKQ
ncbi:MAG TPA: hypothetical protein VFI22_12510, partial [Thermomicrobiales bacterium]|nr:hypothetical protein [Thermomicrobiales bacterium]